MTGERQGRSQPTDHRVTDGLNPQYRWQLIIGVDIANLPDG